MNEDRALSHRTPTSELLKALFTASSGVLMLVTLAVGTALILLGALGSSRSGAWYPILLSVGTGLVATAVYSFFSALLIRNQLESTLRASLLNSLEEGMDKHSTRMLATIERRRDLFLPDREWASSNRPNPDYNEYLNQSLARSTMYIFEGITARTSLARLALLSGADLQHAVFILADPSKPDIILRRQFRDVSFGDQALASNAQSLRRDILTSLVGAHLVQSRIAVIDVILLSEPPIDRAEILDDLAFLSLFSLGVASNGYPPAAAFSSKSFVYRARRGECNSFVASPYVKRLTIPETPDVKSFISSLARVGLNITEGEYLDRKNEFVEALQKLDERIGSRP